jgi:hypothetical protein
MSDAIARDPLALAEQRLRMQLMEADLMNKRADTEYKQTLTKGEVYKIVIAAIGLAVAIFSAGKFFG